MSNFRSSQSVPLHLSISEQIQAWLDSGKYQPGDRLPSETQLMAQFAVSRITIRRAISNLIQQGLVQSQHGKGVFVTKRRRAIYSLSSPFVLFNEDIQRQGLTMTVKSLVFKPVTPSDAVRKTLALSPEVTQVYLQKKFFLINQVAAALDITYIVPDLGQAFAEELKKNMTFPILETHGISIDRIEAILSSRQADSEIAAALELSLGSPIVVYEHTAYTSNDRPILCGETLSSGDRLSYSITLKK
ncbi:MAG: GntR family transcriptional regulator [Hydrococcus sp. Prado102]|jgi:GntR family transcriptional regulator|nr:GntR family transcriptional regulator [Hydrococcus sp. Prado102]